MADKPAIIVKFKTQANQLASIKRLNELVGQAVDKVEPIFPGDESEDLACLFEVQLHEDAGAKELLSELEDLDEIEYAHEPSERRPQKRQ